MSKKQNEPRIIDTEFIKRFFKYQKEWLKRIGSNNQINYKSTLLGLTSKIILWVLFVVIILTVYVILKDLNNRLWYKSYQSPGLDSSEGSPYELFLTVNYRRIENSNVRQLLFSVSDFYTNEDFINAFDSTVCIERILIDSWVEDPYHRITLRPRHYKEGVELKNFCPERGMDWLVLGDNKPRVSAYNFPVDLGSFDDSGNYREIRFYPFDSRTLQIEVSLEGSTANGDKVSFAPDVEAFVYTPEWDQKVLFTKNVVEEDELIFYSNQTLNVLTINVELVRPLSKRLLTVFLMLLLLGFIISMIFVKEAGTALEVGIGILLGLWGIHNVLVPNYIQETTLVVLDKILSDTPSVSNRRRCRRGIKN